MYKLIRLVDVVLSKALPEISVLEEEIAKSLTDEEVLKSILPSEDDIEFINWQKEFFGKDYDNYVQDLEERWSKNCVSEFDIKMGFAEKYDLNIKKDNIQKSSKLIDFGICPPYLYMVEKPKEYESCNLCKIQTPLYLLNRSYDSSWKEHNIAFTFHCKKIKIIYNHIYEAPFP